MKRVNRGREGLGVLCVVGAALCFSTNSVVVRTLSDRGFASSVITLYNGLVRLGWAIVLVPCRGWRSNVLCEGHGVRFVQLVAARNLAGVLAFASMFASYCRIPLGETTSLMFTAPIWTSILAHTFLGERITASVLVASLLACGGVVLIASADTDAQPTVTVGAAAGSSNRVRVFGIVSALGASFFLALSIVTTRAIGDRQPAMVASGFAGATLVAISLPVVLVVGADFAPQSVDVWGWLMLVSGASVSFCGHAFLTSALFTLEAGVVNVLATLEVLFSFVWQLALLGMPSHPASIAGAAVIVVCSVSVGLSKMPPRARSAEANSVIAVTVESGPATASLAAASDRCVHHDIPKAPGSCNLKLPLLLTLHNGS